MVSAHISIDPNVRVRGNQTFVGFEDVSGLAVIGSPCIVYEVESGATAVGRIEDIDKDRRLVYVSVDWNALAVSR